MRGREADIEKADKEKADKEKAGTTGKFGIEAKIIDEIRILAKKYEIDKVILFGSRVRGDYKKVGDIDIAVSGGDVNRFTISVDEETSTLLEYDIVNLDGRVQEELRTEIEKEGVVIYEKRFLLCFEQSWKAMKEILEYNGFEESATGSPRQILWHF